MKIKKFFRGYYCVMGFLVACLFAVNCRGCCFSGWDFLTDDLLPAVCPLLTSTTNIVRDLFQEHTIEEEGPITSEDVKDCLKCGRDLAQEKRRRGNRLVRNGVGLETTPPAVMHFFSGTLPSDTKKSSETSNNLLTATKLLQMKYCSSCDVTPNTFMSFLEHQVIRVKDCVFCKPIKITYKESKYRSIDGTCNNVQRPEWGRRNAPFTRIATPRYGDGIYSMPVSRSGRQLPSPRLLSSRLFTDRPVFSRVTNTMNMQWGQFITHDMVFRAMEVTDEGGIQCCLGNGQDILPPELMNDKCIPICVSDDDPFYRQYGIRCLNFVRSITAPRDDCSLGYAEQMNTVTSYLDGSQIYGSDKMLAAKLRSYKGGKLRQETRFGCKKGYLPSVDDKWAVCDLRNSSEPCYLAGDGRINQTPTLAMIHTIFLREHNRIADILGGLNPLWCDEKIYQETRKIVIAEIQHITYQEWLPLNLGENYVRYYRISPSGLYSREYSAAVNAGALNSFAAAAFRALHTRVPEHVVTCPADYPAAYLHKLSDHYFNPSLLECSSDSIDDMVRGVLTQPEGESDPFCTSQITNLLFKSRNKWGMDLIAMDIQRGRDHGLASYNEYREICGLQRARTFQDLAGEIPQDRVTALSQLYECVDDVDLFVGGALERGVQGSLLGHTFHCLVAEQFYRARVGDRYFYDNGEMPHSFTPDQLKEIKKVTMARLICDNTDNVQSVQRKAFEMESQYNNKYKCDDYNAIPYMDLTAWKKPFDLFDLN